MSIIVNHLTYRYNPGTAMESTALDDINLKIEDGEFIGLIGHTGSGKSTLVQQLNGILKPTSGGVYVDGADIGDDGYDLKKLRGEVGLVFQYPEHQLFETDVFKDVCFGPINLGLTLKESEERAFSVLKELGIEKLAHQSTFHLSGGEKRLVALAGILAMQPQILLLDEPTTGLDQESLERLLAILENLPQACIIVTHDIFFMQKVADTFYTIQKEQLIKMEQPVVHRHKHAHFGGNLAHEHANFQ